MIATRERWEKSRFVLCTNVLRALIGGSMSEGNNAVGILSELLENRGMPRSMRELLEKSIDLIGKKGTDNEKISIILSNLDDISNNPNLSTHVRTELWEAMSVLEGMTK